MNPPFLEWVAGHLGTAEPDLMFEALPGDASLRRYYRLRSAGLRAILADASAEPGVTAHFTKTAEIFARSGVRVPELLAWDNDRGWSLQEDAGSQLLLPLLEDEESGSRWYGAAYPMLRQLYLTKNLGIDLPPYDRGRLQIELDVCEEWFLRGLLDWVPDSAYVQAQQALHKLLLARILEQPSILVHRDFHARNLMVKAPDELVAIDFQDALVGPYTYDLVSLLKDCYKRWPRNFVESQVRRFFEFSSEVFDFGVDAKVFLEQFDLMGLQRHIKVLGVFARLHLRDGKSGYLADLPRVIAYVEETLALYRHRHPELAEYERVWFDCVKPLCVVQSWYRPCE
jgi:aminoglycoside/choline kinase family phosphotransferase